MNQGLLLSGAIAYYALLSLAPLLILMLMLLSLLFSEEQLLRALREYLEFFVPGQSRPLIEGLQGFFENQSVVGPVLFFTMLFFSSLAFSALESAMSVIFFHRVSIKRRHFIVSALMPYLFIIFLAAGLIVVTVVTGLLQGIGARTLSIMGELRSLGPLATAFLYLFGVFGEVLLLSAIYLVMPVGRLSLRHALIGGSVATMLWEITRHGLRWYYTTVSQIQVVYGSFATSVGVLLSVEIGAIVLLMGAQVIAEYERMGRGFAAQDHRAQRRGS
ncbi:MAG: YihY/virulence factor BrkB family protein [Rhodospirillaceae bacterium]|nr:YihY/virulence factor BrkB family protein [Rhodospirillaceae bacterium]